MCGITGFNWNDKNQIEKATKELTHRGPDQHGFLLDDNVSLGMRRLSIIDLSERGRQPIPNENRDKWVVFNGEIYNFKEIRKVLEEKGHKFSSNTDTEVIIHSYEEYGEACVSHFNGMFAFAIWDSENKSLFLARDRLGVKPLYYYFNPNNKKFIFGSEIKAILSHEFIKREFNKKALFQFLEFGCTIDGSTLFSEIKELLPGYIAMFKNGSLNLKNYWEPKINELEMSQGTAEKTLLNLIESSVKYRMVSDVPIGISLSGGLDSSIIAAIMAKNSNAKIKSFCIGWDDKTDEIEMANIVAQHCNIEHKNVFENFNDAIKELPKIVWSLEQPFSKPSIFSAYFIYKGLKENGITVDLVGDGADELFAGYNRYLPFVENSNNYISSFRKKIKALSSGMFFNDYAKYFENSAIFKNREASLETVFGNFINQNNGSELNKTLLFELKHQLPGIQLLRVDRNSMAHSREARVPFLDYRIVEFAFSLKDRYKIINNSKKIILQSIGSKLLPKVIWTRKKLPFPFPLVNFFKSDFRSVANDLMEKSILVEKSFIKKIPFRNLLQKLSNTNSIDTFHRKALFLLTMELFYRIYFENEKISI